MEGEKDPATSLRRDGSCLTKSLVISTLCDCALTDAVFSEWLIIAEEEAYQLPTRGFETQGLGGRQLHDAAGRRGEGKCQMWFCLCLHMLLLVPKCSYKMFI